MEDKVYLETYYKHQPRSVVVDETLANIKAQGLHIGGWMLIKNHVDEAPKLMQHHKW
jgi:hypothetical protein